MPTRSYCHDPGVLGKKFVGEACPAGPAMSCLRRIADSSFLKESGSLTMKALLVDDEKELVATLAERLMFRDIEADWATSGQEALKLAEKRRYDLAVLDVKMPGMSGITLMKRLRERHPGMKFIFMPGHGSEEDFRTGSADAAHYLVKPVKLEALLEKMKAARSP